MMPWASQSGAGPYSETCLTSSDQVKSWLTVTLIAQSCRFQARCWLGILHFLIGIFPTSHSYFLNLNYGRYSEKMD